MNVNVLERDFVPLCDGTMRIRSRTDIRFQDGIRARKSE